jgi:hypothetical protein
MPLWMLIVLLGLIKLPIAALMLWLPFRNDEATRASEPPDQSAEDDGGSRVLPAGPLNPRPRRPAPSGPTPRPPRRGPHGSPPPSSPRRIRTPARSTRPVRPVRVAR